MSIIGDYHTHTFLCKHAEGRPEDYVRAAAEKGIRYLGVSDHSPVPIGFDVDCRMEMDRFEEYLGIVEGLRKNQYGVEILLGVEMDWVPGRADEINTFISKYDFDYVLGSVHYVDDFPVDSSDHLYRWDTPERKRYVWDKYASLMKEMIESIRIDIIGHFDLPKKYKMYPDDLPAFVEKMKVPIQMAAKRNIAIEINTAGRRKAVGEFYPSMELLKAIAASGGKITFGSDSHKPQEIGYCFDEAQKYAAAAGHDSYTVLCRGGKRIEIKFI